MLNVENLEYEGKEQTEPWSQSREDTYREHSSGFFPMSLKVLGTILNLFLRTHLVLHNDQASLLCSPWF